MIFAADFLDAHDCHWDDAESLYLQQRWLNADQLYGFSAECGLKAIMQGLGMSVNQWGTPSNKKHKNHVQDLWKHFRTFCNGNSGSKYDGMLPSGEPFSDWSHNNRYSNRNNFHKHNVDTHRTAAIQICQIAKQAQLDGIV